MGVARNPTKGRYNPTGEETITPWEECATAWNYSAEFNNG
jgi:hypothetical protein